MKIFSITHYTSNKQQFDGGESGIFCLFVGDSHARFGVLRSICSIFTNQLFVNLFHSKNSNLPHCFSDLIHTEYRKLHKNNGHSPFFLPPIMRSSVGQCRNIRFRQLYASHVIITSEISERKCRFRGSVAKSAELFNSGIVSVKHYRNIIT